jgi:hypothetical protein
MEKPKQILIDILTGKKVSRWDCAIHKKEIRDEILSLESEIEFQLDSAKESL